MGIGDRVVLRSGGPAMTIEELAGSKASCVWFEGNEIRRSSFELSTLKVPDPMIIETFGSRYDELDGF